MCRHSGMPWKRSRKDPQILQSFRLKIHLRVWSVRCMICLEEFENYIVGEVILPINHYLVGTENTTLESIERVYSHPQALMQCSKFLNRHGSWQQIGAANTAVAAKKILNENDPTQAAICSEHAAEMP